MIGLKIRYKEPTPKMIVRAAIDASRPRGGPSYVESRESLQARQYFAEQRRKARFAEQNAKSELRIWQATQAAAEHPWTAQSTIMFIVLILSIILGFGTAIVISSLLMSLILGPIFSVGYMVVLGLITSVQMDS